MFKNYSGKLFLAVLLIGCLCMLPAANAATLFEDTFSDGILDPWVIEPTTAGNVGGYGRVLSAARLGCTELGILMPITTPFGRGLTTRCRGA